MIYDVFGNECERAFDIYGHSVDALYRISDFESGGEIIKPPNEDEPMLETYTTYNEAIKYAYQHCVFESNNNATFCLIADEHEMIGRAETVFVDLGKYADFSKMIFLDLGDDHNRVPYNNISAQSVENWNNLDIALRKIPSNRRIHVMGNHDVWFTDENGNTYGCDPSLSENEWVVTKTIYKNEGATRYYGQDFVFYDDEHNIKYITSSGWNFDEQGYSKYDISNSEHCDALIRELEKNDGYDIVLISHTGVLHTYDDAYLPIEGSDRQEVERIYTNNDWHKSKMFIDRNNHTNGVAQGYYGESHTYDFTNTSGKILCAMMGHYHMDAYGYEGIMQVMFDSYGISNKRPIFFGIIDKENSFLNIWKAENTPKVTNFQIPFEDV